MRVSIIAVRVSGLLRETFWFWCENLEMFVRWFRRMSQSRLNSTVRLLALQ